MSDAHVREVLARCAVDSGPHSAVRQVQCLLEPALSRWRFVENFNGKLRDESLNREWFRSRTKAAVLIERWPQSYNEQRPHSAHG